MAKTQMPETVALLPRLYATEDEIAAMMGLSLASWKIKRALYEKAGFPLPDPFSGLRYLPAVQDFLDRHNGRTLTAAPTVPATQSVENLNAFANPNARRRARP